MTGQYWKNAVILTLSGLVLRAAGMLLRIYVAARLGSEGMGLYQLIFTLYSVSISLATSGISVAATRLCAEGLAQRDGPGSRRLLLRLLRLALGLGLLAGMAQYGLAQPAARWMLGDLRAARPLQILAFSLPFMALSAAMRGYFMAARRVLPNVKAQIAEQLVRVAVVAAALQVLQGQGTGLLCAGVVLGNTISEGISCLMMLAYTRGESARLKSQPPPPRPARLGSLRSIWGIMLPVEGSRCMTSALHAAETSLVPACLARHLGDRALALSQFGALKGMALPLMTFPFSFLSTLSGLLMPEIARAHAQRDHAALESLVGRMLTVTLGVSLFAGAFFTVWAYPLAELIYRDRSVGYYIQMLGPIMPFMYLESMVDGVMKGMGEQLAAFRYGLMDSAFRLMGVVVLLPRYGIDAFLAVMALSNLFTCLMNLRRMMQVVRLRFCWGAWVVRPTFFLLAALGVCLALQQLFAAGPGWLRFGTAGGGMLLCYGLLFWRFSLRGLRRGTKPEG